MLIIKSFKNMSMEKKQDIFDRHHREDLLKTLREVKEIRKRGIKMNTLNLLEVIRKIIGDTSPSGDSHIDSERIENAKQLNMLLYELVIQVAEDTQCIFDYRHSMTKVSEVAYGTIKEINTITQDCINGIEEKEEERAKELLKNM